MSPTGPGLWSLSLDPRPTIAILGQGRFGRTLAPLLVARGYTVKTWRRGEPFPDCDLAWITVSDAAVAEVARALPVGPIVLHASGALDTEVLAPHVRRGSLHPIQSFPGPERATPPLEGVPAGLAGHPDAVRAGREIALSLGMAPFDVPGDRRLYHAAAVLAGNFATTLLDAAARALAGAGAPDAAKLLAPLALASIRQTAELGFEGGLTGPFARGDAGVVAGHLAALQDLDPQLATLYRALGQATLDRMAEGPRSPGTLDALGRALQEKSSHDE